MAALRAAIADGRLTSGARLPASRALAADLGVSRGVVVEAYQRLADEGLVLGRTGDGTIVTATRPTARPVRPPAAVPGPPHPAADLDLTPGVPDLSAFPRAAWLRAERAVLAAATGADLGYGDPRGSPALRAALVAWLARVRGVRAAADDLIVVAGVAQSLALLAHTLRAAGRPAVAVEDPGSHGAREELRYWGLRPQPVPVDTEGVDVAALAATGAPTALLTPAHQFPSGVVLSPARRRALVAWAGAGNLLIEDDYDAEHRYDRAPVPAVHASVPGHVAYTGSVSKTLAPGMRLGWLLPPRHLHDDLLAAKYASDLGNPALPQLVLAHLLTTGEYERHLRRVRTRQRHRRDALLAALRAHLPAARVAGVAAGLHLLILLPEDGPDDRTLADRAAAAGVVVQPLSLHRQRPGPPGLVLGYAAHPPNRLHEAARRLAAALPRR
ncbi:GntR family transcriptional regulator [Pilimelia anulata]|uniref:GntR family transcriptional regulator n=1 Tax=Pilimelia anulata TaxID=53371 RepID=A0A8J3B591_9ACTN|nr:PLP-dependent aminotransferase family protein [Pilimelia anulata]GGJ95254.1 GntR family transcriptional regulator [Pilimelia anulata]